ncbi:MAG: hypothetical protein Ta2E_07780 [Mycoplasmoidaceae bacterium]|nr:MAG: hypothetical protein Ta2E_07780 [Mycoplasmoidaceae bacterium]
MTFLYSDNQDLIQFEVQKYKSKPNLFKIIEIDKDIHHKIISIIQQTTIFDDEKIIVFTNADLLNKSENECLVKKLLNINSNCILILSISKKGKIQPFLAPLVKELSSFKSSNAILLANQLLQENLAKFDSDSTMHYFLDIVTLNPFSIKSELSKLVNFSKIITISDINSLIVSQEKDKIYTLLDYIVNNKHKEALILLEDLLASKETIIDIINSIAKQSVLLKIIDLAQKKNMPTNQIISELQIPSWQYTNFAKLLSYKNNKIISNIVDSLYSLDYNIKKMSIDPYIGFKSFILKND